MKTKDLIKSLRESTDEELLTRRRDLKKEHFNLRLHQQSGQLEKPSQLHSSRREVARIETVLTERRRKTAAGAPASASSK